MSLTDTSSRRHRWPRGRGLYHDYAQPGELSLVALPASAKQQIDTQGVESETASWHKSS